MQTQSVVHSPQQRFFHMPRFQSPNYQKPVNYFNSHQYRQHVQQAQAIEFDGKRLRKAVARKTVDYNSSIIKYLEARVWQRDYRDRRAMQPDVGYYTEMMPPMSMLENPINAVTTKFVRTSTNKMRCPIFCVAWTPEGRRLITGASSGEFTLWNGLTFNFETILQAHDSPVRCMVWSHSDVWMVTGDHAGYVKYWQSNMNNVKMFQAHKEPIRGISFCPTDTKFTTCSDDGTVRIWDFLKCYEEKILRGHGADVKCVDWHPQKSLIVSGSKDSQQPIKLWDPKSGQSLATIHAHKNTVMEAKWNQNGNWLLTASRDHLLKLFDIRNMSQEIQTFRGHKKEATSLAWHPIHEPLFASGGSDGSVMFWVVGADKEVGGMEQAHESCVWSLAWHPLGHILCSGSNDHTSKFWTRNRPGDRMRDKYNLNTLPKGQEEASEYDDSGTTIPSIPGMGLEHGLPPHLLPPDPEPEEENMAIPGLDFGNEDTMSEKSLQKKIPFSKPIPKQFQQQWMESKQPLLLAPPSEENQRNDISGDVHSHVSQTTLHGSELQHLTVPSSQGSAQNVSQEQHNYSVRGRGSPRPRMNHQNSYYQSPASEGERINAPNPPRVALLGERPANLMGDRQGPPPPPQLLMTGQPPHPVHIPQQGNKEIQGQELPSHVNEDTGDFDERQLQHGFMQTGPCDGPPAEWRSYDSHGDRDMRIVSDIAVKIEQPVDHRQLTSFNTNEVASYGVDNGAVYENEDFDERQEFHSTSALHGQRIRNRGGPLQETSTHTVASSFPSDSNTTTGDSDMRFSSLQDSDLRPNINIKREGLLSRPESEDNNFSSSRKRGWHDGPGVGDGNYYSPDTEFSESREASDYALLPHPPPIGRGGGNNTSFRGGRGQRGTFRGRSHYRGPQKRGQRGGFLE